MKKSVVLQGLLTAPSLLVIGGVGRCWLKTLLPSSSGGGQRGKYYPWMLVCIVEEMGHP